MHVTIHRGSREVGGSCVEVRSGDDRLIIDLGVPLVEKNGATFDLKGKSNMTGQALVSSGILPDIPGLYHWDLNPQKVNGLLLSHCHMDHCGFIDHVTHEIPVFSGEATQRILEVNSFFTPFAGARKITNYLIHGQLFTCGRFRITPYSVDHSAFDSYAFLIEADGKSVLYSGDLRSHGRKAYAFENLIKALSEKEIDAVLLEGTMFGRAKEMIKTEQDLEEDAVNLLQNRDALALLAVSAHNIDRLVTFYRAAKKSNRVLVVDLYTACVLRVASNYASIPYPSKKYNNLKVFYPRSLTKFIIDRGHSDLAYQFKNYKITLKQIVADQQKIVMIVRPSMLSSLEKLDLHDGVLFIYSMWQGNQGEKGMARLIEFARSKQMAISSIHTSGHAAPETLKQLIDALKPGVVIPIHTFFPERYRELGQVVKMLDDGEVYEI